METRKKQPAPRRSSRPSRISSKEGKRDEFEAVAIKEVLAWQIMEAMKANKISRKRWRSA